MSFSKSFAAGKGRPPWHTHKGGDSSLTGLGHGGRGTGLEDRYGHSTSKVPPYWEPRLETKGYPFHVWIKDLTIWAAGTELAVQLQAPAVAQRLGGTAKDLVREVPPEALRDGRVSPETGEHETGMQMLVRGLERRHGLFAVETSTKAIIDLLRFQRGSESVDEALSRFETIRVQVRQLAPGFDLPVPVTSWLLLEAMQAPRRLWHLYLQQFGGQMPNDEDGFRQLTVAIRHQGHISEHSVSGNFSWRRMRPGQGFLGDSGSDVYGQDAFLGELSDPEYGGDA